MEVIALNQLPEGARVVMWGHRSGAEQHMRCPRAYYLNYEYLGTGINAAPTPIYLIVGSAVHHGLADLLLEKGIDAAVKHAVAYLKDTMTFQLLNPDQQTEQEVLVHGLVYAFYVYAYPGIVKNFEVLCVETGSVEYVPVDVFDPNKYGYSDEVDRCGFIEGNERCVHHHAHMTGGFKHEMLPIVSNTHAAIQSRPDAILRHRQTGEVAGWSWKTIDDPTDMRRSQLHNDLQGFMEMFYGERILERLAGEPVTADEIATFLRVVIEDGLTTPNVTPLDMINNARIFLDKAEERARSARNIPTQIDYIQTVFLVKGKRALLDEAELPWINSNGFSNDTDEYGGYAPGKIYRQMSHLCYRYRNSEQTELANVELYKTGPNKGKPKPVNTTNYAEESWAYRFHKPGNETQSGLSAKWLASPIQPDQVREWIDRLNDGTVYPSILNDERNPHPLAKVIRFEEPLYRDPMRAMRHVEQQRQRFVQIARSVQTMTDVIVGPVVGHNDMPVNEMLVRMDEHFPQHLVSCRSPWRCQFFSFCHTPAESQLDFVNVPEGFELRTPHHPAERAAKGVGNDEATNG